MSINYRAVTKVKGTPVEIGGVQCVMPALSLLALENFQKSFKDFNGDPSNPKNVSFFIDTVHAALKRNYPECTREDVAEGIGMESMEEIMSALLKTSGLVHKPAGDSDSGEAQAETIQN